MVAIRGGIEGIGRRTIFRHLALFHDRAPPVLLGVQVDFRERRDPPAALDRGQGYFGVVVVVGMMMVVVVVAGPVAG